MIEAGLEFSRPGRVISPEFFRGCSGDAGPVYAVVLNGTVMMVFDTLSKVDELVFTEDSSGRLTQLLSGRVKIREIYK